MTDYKRITRRNEDGTTWVKCVCCDNVATCDYTKESCCQVLQDRLAELEDMIEQGLLVKLPCKVGDMVYRVLQSPDFVYGWELDTFIIQSDGIIAFDKSSTIIKPSDWGETVFLTKAEAEARLAELKRSDQ